VEEIIKFRDGKRDAGEAGSRGLAVTRILHLGFFAPHKNLLQLLITFKGMIDGSWYLICWTLESTKSYFQVELYNTHMAALSTCLFKKQ
jgi:hypothetical protein